MIDEMTYSTFLDRYKDKSYIGSGGFAKVYKVFDFAKRKYVVLKVADVRPELKKFTLQNEVELVNQLPKHPNIIRYEACYRFNTGIAGDMDFAVLPFYELGNLEQYLDSARPSLSEKKQIIRGILEGVRFLHQKNCIHRDLKAKNILVHKEGDDIVIKIADFGLSRYVKSYDSAVSNSSIGLTFEYASPEQIRNQKIYKNVDLWAVGVLIYKIITDVSPFQLDHQMQSHDVHAQLEVSKRIVNRVLPSGFDSIPQPYKSVINRCLVVDPKQRIQSADDLIQILFQSNPYKRDQILQSSYAPRRDVPSAPGPQDQTQMLPSYPDQQAPWKEEVPPPSIPYEPISQESGLPPVEYRQKATEYREPERYEEPIQEKSEPRQANKSLKKMSAYLDRISKAWIYIPLYVLFVVVTCWGLFHWWTADQHPKEEAPIPTVESPASKVSSDFLTCFEEGRKALGGTFALIPTDELIVTFEQMNTACLDKICNTLNAIASGDNSSQIFYGRANKGDQCFEPIYNKSLAYHNRQLRDLSPLSLFYDSGEFGLDKNQQNQLEGFIRGYKQLTDDYGLLIIGRASNKGDKRRNRILSERRGKTLMDFIRQKNIEDLDMYFTYFGADPPQLDQKLAAQYEIPEQAYRDITFGAGSDPDFNLRLNQSVLLVFYPRSKDPFGLEE